MIKIEFFHDVICSFCFPMSARMHRIAKNHNNIEIIHRSFALGWENEDFISNFGSREAVAIAGAQSQEEIEKLLASISKDEGIALNKLQTLQMDDTGGSCSIIDGKWKCD